MSDQPGHLVSTPRRRHPATVALGVGVAIALAGIAATMIWVLGAQESDNGDPDDNGESLAAILLYVSSIIAAAVIALVTFFVLAVRRRRRSG